jgi:hypothetical protein
MCRRGRVGRVPGQAPRVASRGHAGAPLELYAIGWSCKLGSHTWSCENSPVCACVPQCAIVSVCFSVGACNNVGMNRKHITRFALGRTRATQGQATRRRRAPGRAAGRCGAPPPVPNGLIDNRADGGRWWTRGWSGRADDCAQPCPVSQRAQLESDIACTHFPDMHVSSP